MKVNNKRYAERGGTYGGVEIREHEGGTPTIRGYAAVFDSEAFNEVIRRGAFTKTVKESKGIMGLWNHNTDIPLASTAIDTLTLEEDDRGLRFEMTPDMETTAGRDAVQNIKSGLITGMSFGFDTVKDMMTEREKDGDEKPPLRELLEVKLYEVSPVTFPWYEDTEVSLKSQEFGDILTKGHVTAEELRHLGVEYTADRDSEADADEDTPEPGTSANQSEAEDRDAQLQREQKVRQLEVAAKERTARIY